MQTKPLFVHFRSFAYLFIDWIGGLLLIDRSTLQTMIDHEEANTLHSS